MANNISNRVASAILAAAICAGVTAHGAYADEVKNTKKTEVQSSFTKRLLIIPLSVQITKEESSNIKAAVARKIELKNNVKLKSYNGVVFKQGDLTFVSISAVSVDGRAGALTVRVDIESEHKTEIRFPDYVSASSEASIKHDVEAEVRKNNKDNIRSVDVTVKSKTCAHVKVTDIWGNVFEKDVRILIDVNVVIDKENSAPQIWAIDRFVKVGDKFNPLFGVIALDKEDGNITDKVKLTKNTVDTSKVGKYEVEYTVTDSNGKSMVKKINVYVFKIKWPGKNTNPVITASDKTIEVGDKFNPLDGVTATDKEEGDLTSKIVVVKNEVDTTKAGIYVVEYKVTDSMDAVTTKDIKVTVENKPENKKPADGSGTTPVSNNTDSGSNGTAGDNSISGLSSYSLPKTGGVGAALLSGIALTSMLSGTVIKKRHKK